MRGARWKLAANDRNVVRRAVVGILQIHFGRELLAHLVERLNRPIAEPVEHASEAEH